MFWDWREREEAAAEAAEPGTEVMTDSESEADNDTTDRTIRGTGDEESLGASGSSGAEWSGAEN